MAIARRLQIYKATYELVKLLLTCQRKFTKQFKYTLGADMQKCAIGLFNRIQKANMDKEHRVQYLEDFIVEFETLKTYMRLAFDFKQIKLKRQAAIYELTECIGRQVTAWKNSTLAKARSETTTATECCKPELTSL